jgi:WD40 repeat protein
MRKTLKYFVLFCCALLLLVSLSQIDGYAIAQKPVSKKFKGVTAITYSLDGKTLASGTADGEIKLYDAKTGKQKKTLSGKKTPITGLAYTSDGQINSSGRDSVVRRWNLTDDKQTKILEGHEHPIKTLTVNQKTNILASAGEDTKVFLWNAETNKLDKILEGHKGFVNGVAISENGETVASAGDEGWIILWNLKTGKQLRTLLGHAAKVNAVAFNSDGTIVASASDDATVRLWNVTDGKQIKVLGEASQRLITVAFTKKEKTLIAAGEDGNVYRWDVASGNLLAKLAGHNASVKAVAVNPDGTSFASADEKGAVKKWNSSNNVVEENIQVVTESDTKQDTEKSLQNQTTTNSTTPSAEKTLIAAMPSPPGGPILLINNASNPFSNYYAEILRNEGFNSFNISDISSVSATTLAKYDIAILAETNLTSAQVTTFSNWVNGGGNLIAMHPDKQLASLLGLTATTSTLPDAYLLVNPSTEVGNGIVNQTIQFHGTADRYTLNGASSIATLYTNASTATSNPAVTLRKVGRNGGKAAAFTYDLARSVVYTRQGNPAWATQERDGFSPIRSDDLFFGSANEDIQPDWVNLNKVAIPQADEQQRLLANLIIKMNVNKKPLPHFWYFPHGKKAVVLMTGDDHATGGTAARFNQFKANSPSGCSVDDWECIRGTSYIYPHSPLTSQQAAAYTADGFEVSLHINTNCDDFTSSSLATFYTNQLSDFTRKYASISAPVTERHHCLVWSDWFSTPQVELNNGIRLDTTYYYWPPSWINNRSGFFTGSGMPMRLANQNGTLIDVYHVATQLTDESGQSYPSSINLLLDKAVGAEGYYGVFNVNAHTDADTSPVADAVVASAKSRGVPIISAVQLLKWLDGRNSSSFGSLAWNNKALSFNITRGANTKGLQAMLPTRFGNLVLNSITLNGSPVTQTTQVIKGIEYAFFPGNAGNYVAQYILDTTRPTVTSTSPTNQATNVSTVTRVTATFSELINPTTINTQTFELRNSANTLVASTVTSNDATRTATLRPSSQLATSTTYTATLRGGTTDPRVKDLAGNALATNFTWTFTTASTSPPQSIWNGSATPTNPSVSDPNAVELGVKFRLDIDGFISGIRFYKGVNNTGTHIGNLWDINGQKLATATFSNETASGWQQVNFSSPVAVTANTVYVASYHTSVGNYAIDNGFFATAGVDNPPLHALRDGENGSNGVYKYGSSGFPDNSYQSSNYWVDVVFTGTP